jgi:hypothetical protein
MPAQAQTSGATVNSGSLLVYQGHAGGTLTVGGQTSYYSGGNIPNISSLAVYDSTQAGVINFGTLTKTGSDPIALTPVYTGGSPILALSPNTTLTTGSTLSLATGSTVSFNGTISGTSNLTFNSGATLVTNSATTVNSGVVVLTAGNSYLGSTGILKTGTGSLVLSNDTSFSGGTNATVTGGTLIFGNGGTVTSGGVLNIGSGSILSPTSNLTIATTITNAGSIVNLGGSGTLTIGNPANIINPATITPITTTGSLGAVLLNNGANVGGNLIVNATSSLTLTGSSLGSLPGKISLGTGTLTISPSSTISLKSLPPIQDTAPGSLGTNVKFLDAALTSNGASILFLPAMQNLASDRLSLHINDFTAPGAGDKIVLQLTFDPTAAAALGDLSKLYLAWFDPADSQWKNAIDGNSDGGAGSSPVIGAYDPTTDFNLGTYGVDTTNSTVWAVIDHDGTFGVASSDTGSSGGSGTSAMSFSLSVVPEPSAAGLLLLGLGVLGRRTRKR